MRFSFLRIGGANFGLEEASCKLEAATLPISRSPSRERSRYVCSDMKFNLPVLIIVLSFLAGCASTGSNPVADMPSWVGGLPADAPPRPGTPAYDAWQAERAKEAARPKVKDAAR
jgi:hypothetical protein